MYFLIIIIGLISAVLSVILLNSESVSRRDKVREAFNRAAIGVYDSTKEVDRRIVYRYPIRSVRYTCGRKMKYARIKVDITCPNDDKTLSKRAALFYVKNGEFCIKRLDQKVIWVSDSDGQLYLLCDKEKVKHPEIPQCFTYHISENIQYRRMDEDYMALHFGDRILMGNTLFEYNSMEVLNANA